MTKIRTQNTEPGWKYKCSIDEDEGPSSEVYSLTFSRFHHYRSCNVSLINTLGANKIVSSFYKGSYEGNPDPVENNRS